MRTVQPSALPADVAERRSDRDPDALPWPRKKMKYVSADWMRRELDEITRILKRDNDEAGK